MTETKELILNELAKLANKYPQQRMGQLIFNYICANCPNDDPFFIEDTKLLEILEKINEKN